MDYKSTVSDIVRVVEALGAGIILVGGFWAFLIFLVRVSHPERRPGSYEELRRNLGRSILLGLEVLIVADLVRTIIVDPTYESVVVLGVIVVDPDSAELRARGRDGRHVALEPLAAPAAQPVGRFEAPRFTWVNGARTSHRAAVRARLGDRP